MQSNATKQIFLSSIIENSEQNIPTFNSQILTKTLDEIRFEKNENIFKEILIK